MRILNGTPNMSVDSIDITQVIWAIAGSAVIIGGIGISAYIMYRAERKAQQERFSKRGSQ